MSGVVRTWLRPLWVAFCGPLAMVLGELVAMFVILEGMPARFDVTAHIFLAMALPGILIAGLLAWLLVRNALRSGPVWYVLLFSMVYLGSQYRFLTFTHNPPELVMKYAAASLCVCGLILIWRLRQPSVSA